MITLKRQWKKIRSTTLGRWLNIPIRFGRAIPIAAAPMLRVPGWSLTSREDTNFTYQLKPLNERYLAHAVGQATGADWREARAFIEEVKNDRALAEHIVACSRTGSDRTISDPRADFNKRLGWYAVARILKPDIIVETGIDKGLGSVVLSAALLKNGKGRFYGTEINPNGGRLLTGPYEAFAEVLYGDSIESLKRLDKIDLFISDSDHSIDYERQEYEIVAPKLTRKALILSDNAHVTPVLMEWAEQNGWNFLYWREEPLNHWYPGAGIGFAYRPLPK